MSGGKFDYAYQKVYQFADELANKLDAMTPGIGWENPAVSSRLRGLVVEARHCAALMKETEWMYSGDIGEDTFNERVTKIDDELTASLDKLQKELDL
jgi:hypothetical protein